MNLSEFTNEKFDVIILAGQSNAEGNGMGDTNRPFKENEKILELADKHKIINDNCVLTMVYPFEYKIEQAKEELRNGEIIGNFAYYFAEEYVNSGLLKEGRKLLIINATVGGTGFSKCQWGLGTRLEERLFEMTEKALNFNAENKIVAFLWHQGEHDAFEHPELTYSTRTKFYYDKFNSFINRFLDKFGKDFPVIAGGFCDEWKADYLEECKAVENAIKRSFKNYKSYFVSAKNLLSNNRQIGNGDTIHFSRDALVKLGKRYFKGFCKIKNLT